MLLVGLTGGMASGKNFIAGLFKAKGCHTLDADEAALSVMSPGGEAYDGLAEAFGREILAEDGRIDRGKLRHIVTEDPAKRVLLESIVHPAIGHYSKNRIREVARRDPSAIIVRHAPLLLETGGAVQNDLIVLVWCTPEKQKERLRARGYPPYEEALKLMSVQMPFEEKQKHADHIINNNGTAEDAEREVERVLHLIKLFLKTEKPFCSRRKR